MTKKIEVHFAPGCFDNFDGTQEELDEMMAEINRLVQSGEIMTKARRMTDAEVEEMMSQSKPPAERH
jgi:hypothetical protein